MNNSEEREIDRRNHAARMTDADKLALCERALAAVREERDDARRERETKCDQWAAIADEGLMRERKLYWKLANATCTIDMMLDEHTVRVPARRGLTIQIAEYDYTAETLDRVNDVFRCYP